MSDLIEELDREMLGVYTRAKSECAYTATYYYNMLADLRGLATAKRLLAHSNAQYGFEKLWELGRLDLTVECLVLRPRFRPLFEPEELAEARRRLKAHGVDPSKCEKDGC